MSLIDHKYPYTNFHELNLDWFLKQFSSVEDFIKKFDPKYYTVKTFNTVSEMKSDTALTPGNFVITSGYYAANDGGAAVYIITATLPSKYSELLDTGLYAELIPIDANVKQYGAVGDGLTDDTQAFSNMYADNKSIILNGGSYYLASGITLNRTMSQIIANDKATIILDSPIIISSDHCRISNINFICKSAYNTDCIVFNHGDTDIYDSIIDNCIIQFFNKAIFLETYASNTRIINCNLYECNYVIYNEYYGGGYDEFNTTFKNCFIFRTKIKLYVANLVHLLFENCYISVSATNFTTGDYWSNIKFVDCDFEADPILTATSDTAVFSHKLGWIDFNRCRFIGKSTGNVYWFAAASGCRRFSIRNCDFSDAAPETTMAGLISNTHTSTDISYGTYIFDGVTLNRETQILSPSSADLHLWNTTLNKINFVNGCGICIVKNNYSSAKLVTNMYYTLLDESLVFKYRAVYSNGFKDMNANPLPF